MERYKHLTAKWLLASCVAPCGRFLEAGIIIADAEYSAEAGLNETLHALSGHFENGTRFAISYSRTNTVVQVPINPSTLNSFKVHFEYWDRGRERSQATMRTLTMHFIPGRELTVSG